MVYSPVVTETVAVRVSFHVRRAHRHGYVRFYGTVAPAEVGAQVGFQLLRPSKSVNEGGTIVRAGTSGVGRFSGRMRLRHRGLYRALVKVSDGSGQGQMIGRSSWARSAAGINRAGANQSSSLCSLQKWLWYSETHRYFSHTRLFSR